MAKTRARNAALFAVALSMGASQAAADQIGVASVTCLNINDLNISCTDVTGPVRWRIVNWLGVRGVDDPFPGSNDLLNASLRFETLTAGTMTWTFSAVPPSAIDVPYAQSDWFDASLVRELVSLRLETTLARTVFGFEHNPRLHFIADNAQISATTTRFPPPLDLLANGAFVSDPVPEPATVTLFGLGLAAFAGFRRKRGRQPEVGTTQETGDGRNEEVRGVT